MKTPTLPMKIDPKFFNVDPKKGITDHLKDAYEDSIKLECILNYFAEVDINPYAENPLDASSTTPFIEFLPDTNLANVAWREGDVVVVVPEVRHDLAHDDILGPAQALATNMQQRGGHEQVH